MFFTPVEILVLFQKLSAIVLLLAILILGSLTRLRSQTEFLGVFVIVGVIAQISSELLPWSEPLWRLFLFVSLMSDLTLWWYFRSMYDEGFTLDIREWCIALIWLFACLLTTSDMLLAGSLLHVAVHGLSKLFVIFVLLHISFIGFSNWQNDLIEARRRQILSLAVLFFLNVLILHAGDAIWRPRTYQEPVSFLIFESLFLLVSVIIFFVHFVKLNDARIVSLTSRQVSKQTASAEKILQKIEEQLQFKMYQDPDLNFDKFAKIVDVKPHLLRAMINHSMGFDNFRHFLNHHRLNSVKEALSDASKNQTQITTIAYDAGFNSIPSFYRLFKSDTGLNPQEYRSNSQNDVTSLTTP